MNDNIKTFTKITPHHESTINMLEQWLEDARAGEVVSVGIIGKRSGGEWQTSFSSSDNRLEDAAMLIELGIRRLGFVQG